MNQNVILVIDDNKTVSNFLSNKIKEKMPFISVEIVQSIAQAQELILKFDSQIILATVALNLIDAPNGEAVELLNSHHIHTIVFTGNYNDETQKKLEKFDYVSNYFFKDSSLSIELTATAIERMVKNIKTKVLVVDDSSTFLSMYLKLLKKQLFKPVFAKDGVEALKKLEENPDIKLILTDYNMPNMDGLELLQKVRKNHPKDELGVIVISGSDEKSISTKFLKYGANDFVQKPFTENEFITRVFNVLDSLDLIQAIKDRANKDFMTGLYNRRYFFNEGAEFFNSNRKAKKNQFVAMFDIDKFKNINDTYGHDVGDVAIIALGNILRDTFKQSDATTILSRFGGEEFCVIILHEDRDYVFNIMESIRTKVEANIIKEGDVSLSYTLSSGLVPVEDMTLDEAVKKSDENLYEAKESGRNKVVFK